MPNSPGSLPLIMQDHAGTVMGGVTLSNFPQTPCSQSERRQGSSSRHWSKTISGAAQSSPMTATFCCFAIWSNPPQANAALRISILTTMPLPCPPLPRLPNRSLQV